MPGQDSSQPIQDSSQPIPDGPPPVLTQYNHYYGNTHSHTDYSDGRYSNDDTENSANLVTPADHFALAKSSGYDFYMTSDHALAKYSGFTAQNWTNTRDQADAATDASFVAIAGFEFSENDGPDGIGHLNVFDPPKPLDATGDPVRLSSFYNWLVHNNIVASFNHPQGPNAYNFDEFACLTAQRREMLTMVEVFKAGHSFYDETVKGLDKGWRMAPVVGIDNHQLVNIPSWDVRTVVLASSLTRAHILDAMRNRRVYAVRDKNLQITYAVNGQIMGSVLTNPQQLNFSIVASDPDTNVPSDQITRIEILGEGGAVLASKTFAAHSVSWNLQITDLQHSYYWVRVFTSGATGADNATAYLAPVWIDGPAPQAPSSCEQSQFAARKWDGDENGPFDYRANKKLIVGDFNGDGQTDFTWFDLTTNYTRSYLSQGNGKFTGRVFGTDDHPSGNYNYTTGHELVVGDFNGDGQTDFTLFQRSTSYTRTYLSLGDGRFTQRIFDTDEHPSGDYNYTVGHELVVGDFNGDGQTDFTLFQRNKAFTRTYLSQGNGNFTPRIFDTDQVGDFDYSASSYELIPGDFNGDGNTDLTMFHRTNNNTRTYLSDGAGSFSGRTWDDDGSPDYNYDANHELVVGDFNGDNRTDFTWVDKRNTGTRTYLAQSGGATFSGRKWDGDEDGNYDYRGTHEMMVGDFDGNGTTDFSYFHWANNNSSTYLSQPNALFSDRKWDDDENINGDYDYSTNHVIIVGDFNGDGKSDYTLFKTSIGDTRTYLKQ